MLNVIVFSLVVLAIAIATALIFSTDARRRRQQASDSGTELDAESIRRQQIADLRTLSRVTERISRIRKQRPAPSEPSYRATVPFRSSAVSDTPPYDPSTDLMNPVNPMSPLHSTYESSPTHVTSHEPSHSSSHDYSSSHSSPSVDHSSHSSGHDYGSSYGGDSYGGGGFDGGSHGGHH